ncbi:MAG TPA: tagatose-bisphosphate aldolase, partial [Anaerolineae bacterium]
KVPTAERQTVVVETARRLTPLGVDVLKAEFPLGVAAEPDEAVWAEACAQLSAASVVPWVLLSAGVTFEQFERQTAVACQNGASGVLAGRAVWQEAADLTPPDRIAFLRMAAAERMQRLARIISAFGRPWTEFHPDLRESVGENWYQQY